MLARPISLSDAENLALGAELGGDLGVHQLMRDERHGLAKEAAVRWQNTFRVAASESVLYEEGPDVKDRSWSRTADQWTVTSIAHLSIASSKGRTRQWECRSGSAIQRGTVMRPNT